MNHGVLIITSAACVPSCPTTPHLDKMASAPSGLAMLTVRMNGGLGRVHTVSQLVGLQLPRG